MPEELVLQTVRDIVDATITPWEANYKHFGLAAEILERIQGYMHEVTLRND